MKALAYIRVSSSLQNYELQVEAIQKAADKDGNTITAIYEDTASGWRNVKRPGMDKLFRAVESRKHDGQVLYIFALSRLTRRGVRDTLQTLDRLALAGVKVKSCTESFINTTEENPFRDVIISIFATVAKLESQAKSDRMKAWADIKRKKGERMGRKRAVIDMEKLRALKEAGSSWREIGHALKVSRSTVKKAFRKLPGRIS